MLGDLDAHGAERLDAGLGRLSGREGRWRGRGGDSRGGRWRRRRRRWRRGGCGRALRQVGFHVLFGDAAAGAGAFDAAEIDIVLARHFAHQRRERTGGLGGGCLLNGWRRSSRRLDKRRRLRRGGFGLCGGGLRSGRGLCRRWRRHCAIFLDARDHGVDADRLAFLHQHLGQRAGGGRRDFGIHFIGGDLEKRFVAVHVFAGLFQPLGQRAFHNAFAHLGHHDVGHIGSLFRAPARAGAASGSWQSKTRPKCAAKTYPTSSSVARTPCAAMEVTGLVNPQGTMYWK